MTTGTISVTDATERERAISTIVAAFISDPFMRWLYADTDA